MILENNVTMIVSTCNIKEKGAPKCEQFWPNDDGKPFFFTVSQDGQEKAEVTLVKTV